MNRTVSIPLIGILLAAACAEPTGLTRTNSPIGAATSPNASIDAPPKKPVKPTFTIAACVNSFNLDVTLTWANEVIDPNAGRLVMNLTFASHLVDNTTFQEGVIGTIAPSDFLTLSVPEFHDANGAVAWDSFAAISADASGAFTASTATLHQPKTGWPDCP